MPRAATPPSVSGIPPTEKRADRSRALRPVVTMSAATAMVAGLIGTIALSAGPSANAAQTAVLSPLAVPGRGATVPFVEQEAEDVATNGTIIGPNRTYTT